MGQILQGLEGWVGLDPRPRDTRHTCVKRGWEGLGEAGVGAEREGVEGQASVVLAGEGKPSWDW